MTKKYIITVLISLILNLNVAEASRNANIASFIGYPDIYNNISIGENTLNYNLKNISTAMPGVNIDFLKDKKEFKLFEPKGKYNLTITAKTENFENEEDLRLNKAEYVSGEKKNEVTLTSTTLNDQFIRSATKCVGSTEKGSWSNTHTVYCATATPHVCEKVLTAWSNVNNVNLNDVGKSSQAMKEKFRGCLDIMGKYTEVLSAFGKDLSGNQALVKEREKIMEQEESNIKRMLTQVKDGNKIQFKNINSLGTADQFAELTKELTGSMSSLSGIGRIHQFVDLCLENSSKFTPTESKKLEAVKDNLKNIIRPQKTTN